jgi:hypothetical protein
MDCLCTFVFFGAGLRPFFTAIVMKGIPLGPTRILPTVPACIAGAALMFPPCCGEGSIMGYAAYLGFDYATKNPGGDTTKLQAEITREVLLPTLIIMALSASLAILLALGIALTTTKPRMPPERPNYGYSPEPPDTGWPGRTS